MMKSNLALGEHGLGTIELQFIVGTLKSPHKMIGHESGFFLRECLEVVQVIYDNAFQGFVGSNEEIQGLRKGNASLKQVEQHQASSECCRVEYSSSMSPMHLQCSQLKQTSH